MRSVRGKAMRKLPAPDDRRTRCKHVGRMGILQVLQSSERAQLRRQRPRKRLVTNKPVPPPTRSQRPRLRSRPEEDLPRGGQRSRVGLQSRAAGRSIDAGLIVRLIRQRRSEGVLRHKRQQQQNPREVPHRPHLHPSAAHSSRQSSQRQSPMARSLALPSRSQIPLWGMTLWVRRAQMRDGCTS